MRKSRSRAKSNVAKIRNVLNPKKIDLLQQRVKDFSKAYLDDYKTMFIQELKQATPVRTGRLREGWYGAGLSVSGDTITMSVSNRMYYAAWVEYGHFTRPGPNKHWVDGLHILKHTTDFMRSEFKRHFLKGVVRGTRFKSLLHIVGGGAGKFEAITGYKYEPFDFDYDYNL